MYALYEDAGKFHAGRVLSETESSLQIELGSGKRAKVKAANVLLRFASPEPEALLASASAIAADIDLDLAWEFAPEGDFGFARAGEGLLRRVDRHCRSRRPRCFGLYAAPHYFRRLGKGNFKKAPEEIVKAALLGIERKRQVAAQVEAWADELAAGTCPPPVREQLYRILFKPDKNAPEYKAVVDAARRTGRPPLELLKAAGAIDSPYEFHWRRFLFENFPRGTGFAAGRGADGAGGAAAGAGARRSRSTTRPRPRSTTRCRCRASAAAGSRSASTSPRRRWRSRRSRRVDRIARDRLSTVYIPGHKLTMLPDAVVEAFTLAEGREAPVVSLYVTVDEATLATLGSRNADRARS